MTDLFDPYRVWLSIPAESRPPTHYDLLGISPKEQERKVIEAAIVRQSAYVRNFQIGRYSNEAALILNEIAAAKVCLLDPAKRAKYDAELKERQPSADEASPQALAAPPIAAIDLDELSHAVATLPPAPGAGANRQRRLASASSERKRAALTWQIPTVAGAAPILALLLFVSVRHRGADEPSGSSSTVTQSAPGGLAAADSSATKSIEIVSSSGRQHPHAYADGTSPPKRSADAIAPHTDSRTEEIPATMPVNAPEKAGVENATGGGVDIIARDTASARARFTPLDLSGAATTASAPGLLGRIPGLIFNDWSPKEFEGVPFELIDPRMDRVPNVIVLYGPHGELAPTMPTLVRVPCSARAKAVHFLSGVSGWGAPGELKAGSVSMIVCLRYADGQTENHPLRNGEHFAEWVTRVDVPKSKLAFRLGERQLRYFAIYPNRHEPIEGIDLIKGPDETSPIVMAITIEEP